MAVMTLNRTSMSGRIFHVQKGAVCQALVLIMSDAIMSTTASMAKMKTAAVS